MNKYKAYLCIEAKKPEITNKNKRYKNGKKC